ncbi:SERTA domain-containing protein 2-like [Cheilinus undulatus]|uniref:SERTA domain-containing protein 2-like n=1 Tax=Cheilinus undulatus TaxID=241271 RepID=UPI001BD3A5DF|nr:SERTA domain-containing protein 2-like [Cheilinus undulatus]
MLANGLKRKLRDHEDSLEEVACPPVAGTVSQASASLQRQTVLNMSLVKLYGPQLGADLRLRRRVLINNIIRRIHDDLRQEGGVGTLFLSATPSIAATSRDQDSYRPSLSGLTALDSCLTPASLLEEDLPMFFTLPSSSSQLHLHHSPRLPPPRDSFSSALEEIEELCPSSSSSRPPSPPPQSTTDVVMTEEEGRGLEGVESRVEKPLPAAPPSSASFLTDFALDDVLFTDIDASMYDLGPCPPPSGAPPTKMAPVMMAVGGTQSTPFKMDLAELDHIMEVLVGS